jgi:hypothetical protein
MPRSKEVGQVFLLGADEKALHADLSPASDVLLRTSHREKGYELQALVPLTLLAVDPNSEEFLIEAAVSAMPPGDGTHRRTTLCGSWMAYKRNRGYGRAYVSRRLGE